MDPDREVTSATRPVSLPQRTVLAFIEQSFCEILAEIRKRPCGNPTITLKRITAVDPVSERSTSDIRWRISHREVSYGFPGKTQDEAWRFACVGKILAEIHEAISTGVVVTKRDIYYRDPELFRQQTTIDRYVDDIAYTCGVTRADLNVTAASKGLVAGLRYGDDLHRKPFELATRTSETMNDIQIQEVKWILVVEKEATFRLLIQQAAHTNDKIGQGILITGKGYPDLLTKVFLRSLLDYASCSGIVLPVFGLFDCDPDGVNILLNYRHGSKALAQEHMSNVPEMKWLGVRLDAEFAGGASDTVTSALTTRDRKKARSMLDKDVTGTGHPVMDCECRRALQHMLILNLKMEIQIPEGDSGRLWLERRISESMGWLH